MSTERFTQQRFREINARVHPSVTAVLGSLTTATGVAYSTAISESLPMLDKLPEGRMNQVIGGIVILAVGIGELMSSLASTEQRRRAQQNSSINT